MSLGSNQGNTYKGREGEDLAFKLVYQPDMTEIQRAFGRSRSKKAAADQKKAAGQANLAKWNKERPDFFWAHDQQKQKQLDDLFDWGSKLMEAGIKDPVKSSKPQAAEFQKAMGNISAIAKESKAIEGRYNKDRQVVLNDKKGVYTDDSKQELMDWYENSKLDDIIKEGMLPPKLKFKDPKIMITPTVDKLAKSIADGAPIENFIEAGKGIIADDPDLTDKVAQVISEMNPAAQSALKKEVVDAGLDPNSDIPSYYLAKLAKVRKFNKPADVNKLLDEISDFKAGSVVKKSRFEEETGDGDTKTTTGRTKRVPFKNSLGLAESEVAMLNDAQVDLFMNKEYITYATNSKGELQRDKHGALVPSGRKVVKDKKTLTELVAYKNALKNAYEKESGVDLALSSKNKARGWSKKKNDDYDVWQQSLSGNYPEDGSPELRKTNQQRAISWLNGLEIDGYKVKNGQAEFHEAGAFEHGDEWWDRIRGEDGFVTPEKMNIIFERYSEGRENGYNEVKDTDPYIMNLFEQKEANTGLTRTWYSKQFDNNNLLFKPATEEDILSKSANEQGSYNSSMKNTPSDNKTEAVEKFVPKWKKNK